MDERNLFSSLVLLISLAAVSLGTNLRPSIYGFKEGLKAFESYNRRFKKPVAGLRRDDDTAEIALAIRGSIITRFAKRLLALLSYSCHYGILHDSYSCSTGNQAEAVMCNPSLLLLGRYRTFY